MDRLAPFAIFGFAPHADAQAALLRDERFAPL
jgi:hypothetical protein